MTPDVVSLKSERVQTTACAKRFPVPAPVAPEAAPRPIPVYPSGNSILCRRRQEARRHLWSWQQAPRPPAAPEQEVRLAA